MKPPRNPLLIYDGDCGFCRAWIARWQRATGDEVEYAPYQEVAERFPEIPRERFAEAVHLIEPDGSWTRGAEAVFRSLAHAPGGGAWSWLYRHVPAFAAVSEWAYRQVARHRPAFDRLTRLVWGEHVAPPGETLTAWIFLRLLGLVYAAAFLSLWTQIIGLAGRQGIYPVAGLLQIVRERVGLPGFWYYPTLCWLSPTDGCLHTLCALGTLCGLLVAAGFAPVLGLAVAWIAYLSLATVGQDFLWFQWDGLLLETGFLALLLAPWRGWSRPSSDPAPSRGVRFMFRWLLFRLMFTSAVVKLASGDPAWRSLTALSYHYQTQPLPPWTAWYAHQLPAWFQQASVVVMFAIEGMAPFFLFAPRRIRFAAAAALAGFQVVIMTTGNYGFFNLLSLALCVLVLDDGVWPKAWRSRFGRGDGGAAGKRDRERAGRWPTSVVAPAVAVVFGVSLVSLFGALRWNPSWMEPLPTLYRLQAPLRLVNPYGLFAIMTTRRPEIVMEGSADGVEWRPYEFRWKPGEVARQPEFMAPHMPRLDWQMWFAALGDVRREPWFLRFSERLLQGSPPVLALLEKNPFPHSPPGYVRAALYDYRFSDAATRRATGAWWTREPRGLYCPVLTLVDGRLAVVEEGGAR